MSQSHSRVAFREHKKLFTLASTSVVLLSSASHYSIFSIVDRYVLLNSHLRLTKKRLVKLSLSCLLRIRIDLSLVH